MDRFESFFNRPAECFFSAPGRTELGGNHTDHQHGLVLAAAVTMDTRAAVAKNGLDCIRIQSEGYEPFCVELSDLSMKPEEKGTSASLVRGITAAFAKRGVRPVGFDAYITSTVLAGSGLSSSASFEVLIGTILNELTGAGLTPIDIARIGQFAENAYFGKPSGLLDQTTSACGGVVSIDFRDTTAPVVTRVNVDFSAFGYQLLAIDCGAGHENLTHEYAAIPEDLEKVCGFFGKRVLRDVPEEDFYANIPVLKQLAGDRALLRAIHVYEENKRVPRELEALISGDFEEYLRLVNASGASSWQYLQNVIPAGNTVHQEMALTLALSAHLLDGKGATRLQGGGFGGTIQAYVPIGDVPSFTEAMEGFLGKGTVVSISIRKEGGVRICNG